MTIAILAMQGAFLEHGQMLDRGRGTFRNRKKEDLDRSFDRTDPSGGRKYRYEKLLIELTFTIY